MYQTAAFKDYLINKVGAAPSTFNTYNSFLSRIDKAVGGLDEKIEKEGTDKMLAWSRTATEPPFDVYPSHARSVFKRYISFLIEKQSPEDDDVIETENAPLEPTGLAFRLEQEMQAAVRKQLSNLEPGLTEADGGAEVSVSTGSIDILAKDKDGKFVVIELKAGRCPPGAMEQALGYAQSVSEEKGVQDVRVMLIASDFSDRIRAAAKRTIGLTLLTYEFSLRFNEIR
ncbi:DUF91 domain-containing protein [Bradyrhizobium sediminis]|uniref:DUF91 domain-containing protein n=1 Tax=Bradyrhizobium sediminis TaxID=2840469 RepID=A0A975RVI8_9BRAD|nr:endonuclease NucS domain-containing protein [Bradyrhizobium sediminis]QWG21103.1 DUF91 domain-containing protein [Bradyrhizobium sediminis]